MKLHPAKCAFAVLSRQKLGHVVSKRGLEPDLTLIKNLRKEQEPRTIKDVQSLNGKIMALNCLIPRVSEKYGPHYKAIKGTKKSDYGEEQKKDFEKIREYLNTAIELSVWEEGEEL